MKNQSFVRTLLLGTTLGFAIEAVSVLGSPYLAAILYRSGGLSINVDPFLIQYPLICIGVIAAYLSITKKAYGVSLGMAIGFALATVTLLLMLRGA